VAALVSLQRAAILLFAVAAGLAGADTKPARAAEAATGIYLLGSKTAMAGFVPPPGTYVQSLTYYYKGDTADLVPFADRLTVGLNGSALMELGVITWIAPRKVLGGNVGFGVFVPYGRKQADAHVELNLQRAPIGVDVKDDQAAFGDLVGSAIIGWHAGNWHWNFGALVNAPTGFWQRRRLTNLGFNRWTFDASAAVTWLDPKSGIEVSGSAGLTLNLDNPANDYQTGTEGHLEFALMRHIGKDFSFGVAGYHYQQVTGDSGAGARLGDFKGRVSAVGPMLTYSFTVDKTPISTSVSWMHEFNAKNRLEGNSGLFNVVIPLGSSR
jgi:hypothetical protein